MANIREGVVKWFSKKLGYGFIENPDGQDVFVHFSAVPGEQGKRNLAQGDRVTYEEVNSDNGLKAAHVYKFQREYK